MRFGDLLEWAGGAALTAAGWEFSHRAALPFALAGAFLIYEAQCHGATPLPKFRKAKP